MKKMHKILKIIGVVAGVAAIMVVLGFVGSMRSAASCEALEVKFTLEETPGLVSEADIRSAIGAESGPLVGDPLNEIDSRKVENAVISLPHVKRAAVYKTIDKRLLVEIDEREPMLRLIDMHGTHALLDTEGYLMPLSHNTAPRLPVVSGLFSIPPKAVKACAHVGDSLMDTRLESIYYFSQVITQDAFWKAQLQHTEVNMYGDFIAYPLVGGHTINFGPAEELERKLGMLKTLYTQGLGTSNWNKYSAINLKYRDQIVCTKK